MIASESMKIKLAMPRAPTLSNSPVYRISNGFCANLCYGYYGQGLCQLAVTVQIIWEEHWQELKAPSTFKLGCWDIHFKHSSPLTRLFLLMSQVLFDFLHVFTALFPEAVKKTELLLFEDKSCTLRFLWIRVRLPSAEPSICCVLHSSVADVILTTLTPLGKSLLNSGRIRPKSNQGPEGENCRNVLVGAT